MAALLPGTLFEEDGCLFVEPDYRGATNDRFLILWPFASSAERTDRGTLRILRDGEPFAETGEHVELGGGMVGESPGAVDNAQHLTGTTIPDRCRADGYWLASPPSGG